MDDTRRGLVLIALGVAIITGPLVATALATPGLTVGEPPDVVVGVQGTGVGGAVVTVEDGAVRTLAGDAESYHDVTPLADGRVLAAFAAGTTDCGPYRPPCAKTGARILAPNGSVLWEWTFRVRSFGNSELHDIEPLPSADLLAAGMDRERVFVLNRTKKAIVWQWNASEHYDAPADPTREDWLHINDVDRISEGRYLVSVRNANQLLIIQRGQGVVEVINEDRDPSVIRGQHNPQWLGEGRVLVADSSNDRVVELKRQGDTWEPVWSVHKAGQIPFEWPRDADRLANGHTLITDSRNNRVLVVDEDGDLVSSVETPPLPYEADLTRSGEPLGGPAMAEQAVPAGTGESNGGVLSPIYVGVKHAIPTPHWFAPMHVLAGVFGVAFVIAGVWLGVTGRRGDDTTTEAQTHAD